eukprot:4914163-Prymnesium_polylepis.1
MSAHAHAHISAGPRTFERCLVGFACGIGGHASQDALGCFASFRFPMAFGAMPCRVCVRYRFRFPGEGVTMLIQKVGRMTEADLLLIESVQSADVARVSDAFAQGASMHWRDEYGDTALEYLCKTKPHKDGSANAAASLVDLFAEHGLGTPEEINASQRHCSAREGKAVDLKCK